MTMSVAMSGETHSRLARHLLRPDGQEDLCLMTYRRSTGASRTSALIGGVHLPQENDREVHGNASFRGDYILRVASEAAKAGDGVAIAHSHPGGRGWQAMSGPDADAESAFAYLVSEITGLPLVGMTLAGGDERWSARVWERADEPTACETVRVVGDVLTVSWNDELRPPPPETHAQTRTVSGWGSAIQADLARLRILVVGVGSVGLDLALRLVMTGVQHVGLMDYDIVKTINLDRLLGATWIDALLRRRKVDIGRRLLKRASTAAESEIPTFPLSVCDQPGLLAALDYDVIFSCVDRPWPRAVLNMLAMADFIPVIDSGLQIDAFPDGGLRNATWRSHVIRPGRPCLACNRQLDLAQVALDRQGLLEDPAYIAGAEREGVEGRENVALLSINAAASALAQFVSLVAAPGGLGEPGPLQYVLATHTLSRLDHKPRPHCYFEQSIGVGDGRLDLTANDPVARAA